MELTNEIMSCEDIDIVKNCLVITTEACEQHLNKKELLGLMKEIKSEVSGCHYTKEMAQMHLKAIGELPVMDVAKDYWYKVDGGGYRINIYDWCVLWGEMERMHCEKIHRWFGNLQDIDYEAKVYDECIAYLDTHMDVFNTLNV